MAFAIIVILYASIGVMAVAGSITLSQKLIPTRFESAFFGLFLIAIAAFYLAFTAYFGDERAWELETTAVLTFAALGLLGIRMPLLLIAGYALHGGWDLLHEIYARSWADPFGGRVPSDIPLAYGVFCATYDVGIAAYFYTRRAQWKASWNGSTA